MECVLTKYCYLTIIFIKYIVCMEMCKSVYYGKALIVC